MTPLIFLVALATSIPATNIDNACQAAKAGAAPSDQKNAFESCVHDESAARDELKQKWGSFSAASKDDCAEPKGGFLQLCRIVDLPGDAQRFVSVLQNRLGDALAVTTETVSLESSHMCNVNRFAHIT
jgi:hypothetical protein